MQQIARQKELLRVLVIAGLGLALGWSLGYPLMGLMIGLLVVIVLMYRTMLALYRWSLRQGAATGRWPDWLQHRPHSAARKKPET